jgi:TonB family protein
VGVLLSGAGCGDKPAPRAPAPVESSGAEERREESPDSLAISGLRGTLSQEEIKKALDPRMGKFARCIQQRSGEVEWLAGGVTIEFQVKLDGSVAQAYPRDSSLGDRATERCVMEVAQATRFPAPRGGEADFAWSFEVPLDNSIREPVNLPEETIQSALSTQGGALATSCGAGSYGVTAYVDPEGKVVAAGASAADAQSAQQLDCVAATVQGFTFPSPGSYAAKIRFSVP